MYVEVSKTRYENLDFSASTKVLFQSAMSHPTDTHPTINERMAALSIEQVRLSKENLAPSDTCLTDYFDDPGMLNESLSISEHRLMLAIGKSKLPPENQTSSE